MGRRKKKLDLKIQRTPTNLRTGQVVQLTMGLGPFNEGDRVVVTLKPYTGQAEIKAWTSAADPRVYSIGQTTLAYRCVPATN